jgi:hypothetical protein
MKKPTCLQTDWSKTGIGFLLLQKNCDCEPLTPVQGGITFLISCQPSFKTIISPETAGRSKQMILTITD